MFKPRHRPALSARLRNLVWPRTGLKRAWLYMWHRVRRISATPHSIALGLATGVFMGFNPLIGFHLIISAIICTLVGGSIIAAAIGTLVCNPVMCPLMMVGNYQVGMVLIGETIREDFVYRTPVIELGHLLSDPLYVVNELWEVLAPVFVPMFIGSILMGLAAAIPTYFAARAAIESYQRRRRERLRAGRAATHA